MAILIEGTVNNVGTNVSMPTWVICDETKSFCGQCVVRLSALFLMKFHSHHRLPKRKSLFIVIGALGNNAMIGNTTGNWRWQLTLCVVVSPMKFFMVLGKRSSIWLLIKYFWTFLWHSLLLPNLYCILLPTIS
jgi:hypothetical protein